MSITKQNASIARLIVAAISIDGLLSREERQHLANALDKIGMAELIADVGVTLEEDLSAFNLFEECRKLLLSLGQHKTEVTPLIFRMVADVVALDRFVSLREATFLSALSKALELPKDVAKSIFKQVMAERRGRLEVAGSGIDADLNPHLKELLSFPGAESIVGDFSGGSFAEYVSETTAALAEGADVTDDDIARAWVILGLDEGSPHSAAERVWKETIRSLDLPRMAELGETYVTAAISRITRINDAFKTVMAAQRRKS